MPAENSAAFVPTENLHAWEAGGADSAEALSAWVSARLAAHEAALAALLAVEGARTPENSLRLYDAAIEQLNLAGAQAGILNSVAADKAVRDQAQMEAQRVAHGRQRAEPEPRGLRRAGGQLSLRRMQPARPQSITWSARCWAIGWPAWTRTRPRATTCKRCTRRPRGSRSNSAATSRRARKTIEATPAELEGLPADYSRGIRREMQTARRLRYATRPIRRTCSR